MAQHYFQNLKFFRVLSAGALLVALGACSNLRDVAVDHSQWLTWHPALKNSLQRNAIFEFEIVPQEQGRYELTGQTELPEGSKLAIAAVRYLKLDPDVLKESPSSQAFEGGSEESNFLEVAALKGEGNLALENLEDSELEDAEGTNPTLKRLALDPSYTILDYAQTEVKEGEWEAQLDLWKVAKDGRYQESWQLHQKELEIAWKPEPDVIFLATLIVDGAADRLQPVQDQLAEKHLALSSTLIHTSLEGEQYFQSAQLLPIELPEGRTTPPGLRVQDINGGWGERYLLVEQDPLPGTLKFPTKRNSDAPGSPVEFIQ